MRRLLCLLLMLMSVPVFAQSRRKDMSKWQKYIMRVVTVDDTGYNAPLQQLTDANGRHAAFSDLVTDLVHSRRVGTFDITGRAISVNRREEEILARPGVRQYVLFEKVAFDQNIGKMVPEVIAIGPYDSAYAMRDGFVKDNNKLPDCTGQEYQPLFFVKYAALKPLLEKYTLMPKGKLAGKPMTADAFLSGGKAASKMICVNGMENEALSKGREGLRK